jgi:hypothetical protein
VLLIVVFLSDLQSYKNMGINVPSLFGVIYKVDRTKDAKQFIEYLNNPTKDKFYTMLNTQIPRFCSGEAIQAICNQSF